MSPSVTSTTSSQASTASSSSANSPTAPVTENMFLQLLVAQLQNQDPTNPADSTQFVTQLAQFQTMEQSMNQGETLTSILSDTDQMVAAMTSSNAATGATSGTNGTSGTNSTTPTN
jgi:flagellar basal-body rod modification protein FlgD